MGRIGLLVAAHAGVIRALVFSQDRPRYQVKSPRYWVNYDYRGPRADLDFSGGVEGAGFEFGSLSHRCLAGADAKAAIPVLAETARTDEDPYVRKVAAKALTEIEP